MSALWTPAPITPIPALAELRDRVLARSAKRLPWWRFRFAPDFVTKLQPQPTPAMFKGVAVAMADADAAAFNRLEFIGSPATRMQFPIMAADVGWWNFRQIDVRHRDQPYVIDIGARLLMALATRFDRLSPAMMLQPQCLICGRALTDVVSQARMIGPECPGTSSLDTPIFKLPPRRRKPRQMFLSDFGWFDKP